MKLNREYLMLVLVVCVTGLLLYSNSARSQSGGSIAYSTTYPIPFGEYTTMRASMYLDMDDPDGWPPGVAPDPLYILNPDNITSLRELFVADPTGGTGSSIRFELSASATMDATIFGDDPNYFINLNPDGAGASARVFSLSADGRIYMGADSESIETGGQPVQGKHVYDLAEGMEIEGDAGDVVIVGETGPALVPSSKRFDSRIAGVVSTDPKLYMGPGEGKSPLALAGIVSCKVTAENGPIKRGALLVSSSLPGHAMAAAPGKVGPGMLVGKALQELPKGTGKIFILVNKK